MKEIAYENDGKKQGGLVALIFAFVLSLGP